MGRKKTNPGIYLYPHDILSSPRCRSLTPGGAGIYFFLFLRLCDPPIPGAYRLRDWEPHPKWQKSDTRKCLGIADKRERLPLFAKWLAKNDLPWTKNEVLPYLQELYDRGIIIVEGDMLIQPRLYVDNGFDIPDIDGDGDPVGSILDDPVSGQMRAYDNTMQGGLNLRKNKGTEKGTINDTEKGTKKGTKKSRVGTGDARAQSKRVGVRDNNINNGNIGGVGEKEPDTTSTTSTTSPTPSPAVSDKTQENTPTTSETAQISTNGGKVVELPTEEEKPRQKPLKSKSAPADQSQAKQKSEVADNPPTLADVQAYADERAQQGKPFLYVTPEEFFNTCEMDGWKRKGKPLFNWKAYMLRFEQYRKDHDEPTVEQRRRQEKKQGESVPQKPNKDYDEW